MLSTFEHLSPQKLWAPKYWDRIKLGDAITDIDNFHHYFSAKGLDIIPNAERWNNVNNLHFILGKLLRDHRVDEATTIAQRWNLYKKN